MSNKGPDCPTNLGKYISAHGMEEVSVLDDTSRGAAGFDRTRIQSGPANDFGASLGILSSTNE